MVDFRLLFSLNLQTISDVDSEACCVSEFSIFSNLVTSSLDELRAKSYLICTLSYFVNVKPFIHPSIYLSTYVMTSWVVLWCTSHTTRSRNPTLFAFLFYIFENNYIWRMHFGFTTLLSTSCSKLRVILILYFFI